MIAISRQLASSIRSVYGVQLSVVKLSNVRSIMNKPTVFVKQGELQGAALKSVLGSPYTAFYDIPFAAAPIGELRFKDPQPPAPWSGVKDVSQSADRIAPQLDELPPKDVIGDEDCLYLNVYTTSLTGRKPVMFWIHGGGYVGGTASSKFKKPDYLMSKDVVLVAANYRLGAFGFLNLGHRDAPGNMGLKDIIAALEWVKDNITNFGGDPNNVTIFGASAGGTLCQALLISPRAKGLFHKAILQSGVLSCTWAMNEHSLKRSFKLASLLGTDSTDPEEIVKFLRTIPAEDVIRAQNQICELQEIATFSLPFVPTCDDVAENPVLPQPIEQLILEDIHIPVITGYTSHEYIMFLKDKTEKTLESHNKFLPFHVKNLASLKKSYNLDTEELLKVVKEWYLRGDLATEETAEGLVLFMSDTYFGLPTRYYVEDRVKRTSVPTYFYQYSYVGNQKTHTDLLVNRAVKGASHVDELSYLFYIPVYDTPNPPAEGTRDRAMIERITSLWTNFARTGNPTPYEDDSTEVIWKPVTKDKMYCLDIGDESKLVIAGDHILSFADAFSFKE